MKRSLTVLALIAFTLPCFAQSVPVPKAHEGKSGYWISEEFAARLELALGNPCRATKEKQTPAPQVLVVHPPNPCPQPPRAVVAPPPLVHGYGEERVLERTHGTNWGKVAIGAVAGFTAGVLVYHLLDDKESDHHHTVTVDHNHYLICTEGLLAVTGQMMCGGD